MIPSESRNAPRAKFKIPSEWEINNEDILSYQFLLSVAIQTQCESEDSFRPNSGYLQPCKKFSCKSWRECQSSCFSSASYSWRFITATLVRVKYWAECSLGRILASSIGFYKFTLMLWKSLDMTGVLQWTLLAPSLHWEFSMSTLKLIVKRAPVMPMLIEGRPLHTVL